MNVYEFQLTATCPNGKLRDRYDCKLVSQTTIMVERIADVCSKIDKAFQEDIADRLRNEFQCRVIVIGWHFDVKVTCVRE